MSTISNTISPNNGTLSRLILVPNMSLPLTESSSTNTTSVISSISSASMKSSTSTPSSIGNLASSSTFDLAEQPTLNNSNSSLIKQEIVDLIDFGDTKMSNTRDEVSVVRRTNVLTKTPPQPRKPVTPIIDINPEDHETLIEAIATMNPPLQPWPIKLRLKLTECSEVSKFGQFVEKLCCERASNQVQTDRLYYCKHIQYVTSQHIEQSQTPGTLHIFYDTSRDPIRLTNIDLQSTVASVLSELESNVLAELENPMLKLRTHEEYLHYEDKLCDLEYVHKCINSLKPIQFVLVERPTFKLQSSEPDISFLQFCIDRREKYFQTTSETKLPLSGKPSYKTKQSMNASQSRLQLLSISQWFDEIRQNIDAVLEKIVKPFNRFVSSNSSTISINEQKDLMQELVSCIRTIQNTCSDTQSPTVMDKVQQLKIHVIKLITQSQNSNEQTVDCSITQLFIANLYDLLLALISYIEAYCRAFLIPYRIEIQNQNNELIDVQQIKALSTTIQSSPCSITESSELLAIHINSLVSLPPNIKTVRVVAHLCYGSKSKERQITKLMQLVRYTYQETGMPVHFDQPLVFRHGYLCALQRESVVLFEVYGSFHDENDTSVSTLVSEAFEGGSMRLIGWCSQALFDDECRLVSGEHYLGVMDATRTSRASFTSLRNILDRNCPILTVTFPLESFYWPDAEARNDLSIKSFTEISQKKQEYLSQLLNRPTLLLTDHSTVQVNEPDGKNWQLQLSKNPSDKNVDFSTDPYFLWSHREYLSHIPYAFPKLLKSRSVWDHPSLMDIYGLLDATVSVRKIDEIESLELLLPAFPDMRIRSFAYQTLLSQITSHELIMYLPQLLQMIKFDYTYLSPVIKRLLEQSTRDNHLAHQLYWHLRQLLSNDHVHFVRYYYVFVALLYVVDEQFRVELENEYDLCVELARICSELKNNKITKDSFLIEQLKELNIKSFESGICSCRLPCQFSFLTNGLDIKSCSIFSSFTIPVKLVFNPVNLSTEKYSSIFKVGDDLRQDQVILQLLYCMDKIWRSNNVDYRLSIFNVMQTQDRGGFVEMINDCETLLSIEKPQGTIKGTFGESALYKWLCSHNTREEDFRLAVENFTYSCAGYCVATYLLGIGDRHNENIMVKRSGHLFHIDFGKYLGDKQKFGWFNRDRAPFVFTKQMLYAMSDGGISNDAMHRFVDLCCNAFSMIRQNSSLLLLQLSHLCSSNVPNLNYDAVRFVNERLAPSLNYAESITHFTKLIVDSLSSTWTVWNGFIHKMAQPTSSNRSTAIASSDTILGSSTNPCVVDTNRKLMSAIIVSYEKRVGDSYLYRLKVTRLNTSHHYRTYKEFYKFSELLKKQLPLIGLSLTYTRQTENHIIAERRLHDIDDFLRKLFRLPSDIIESNLVCEFFHTTSQDQQINEAREKSNAECGSPSSSSSLTNNQSKIRIQLTYDGGKLFVMVRHAYNLPTKNGNEPSPYCKCYLLPDETKSTKLRGKIAESRNPIFNDTFTYKIDFDEVQKRILRVGVWNYVLNIGNHMLGTADIILSTMDWSKENIFDCTLVFPDGSSSF